MFNPANIISSSYKEISITVKIVRKSHCGYCSDPGIRSEEKTTKTFFWELNCFDSKILEYIYKRNDNYFIDSTYVRNLLDLYHPYYKGNCSDCFVERDVLEAKLLVPIEALKEYLELETTISPVPKEEKISTAKELRSYFKKLSIKKSK